MPPAESRDTPTQDTGKESRRRHQVDLPFCPQRAWGAEGHVSLRIAGFESFSQRDFSPGQIELLPQVRKGLGYRLSSRRIGAAWIGATCPPCSPPPPCHPCCHSLALYFYVCTRHCTRLPSQHTTRLRVVTPESRYESLLICTGTKDFIQVHVFANHQGRWRGAGNGPSRCFPASAGASDARSD